MSESEGFATIAGSPDQIRAWNAERRARVAAKRRAVSHLRLIDAASGVRSVNQSDRVQVFGMHERDG